jgi:16S rRNA (guanine966-N2)-methyltransferase
MRITSGSAKGHTLKVPQAKDLRPAKEMVRLAIFSILGEKVNGAQVLDLFAGTGAYGIEALSRGAEHGDFVEINHETYKALEENVNHTKLKNRAKTHKDDAFRYIQLQPDKKYDIIFFAPPYRLGAPKDLLYNSAKKLKEGGVLIIEHRKEVPVPEIDNLKIIKSREYGQTGVTFLEKMSGTNNNEENNHS